MSCLSASWHLLPQVKVVDIKVPQELEDGRLVQNISVSDVTGISRVSVAGLRQFSSIEQEL